MRKRIVAILLTIALLMGILPVGVAAAETVASGTCGDSLTWALDSNGVLTISGSGAMNNWYYESPWHSNRTDIKEIVISDGVTSIGDYAFCNCESLTSVALPD